MRLTKLFYYLVVTLSVGLAISASAETIKVGFITKFPADFFSTLQNAAKDYAARNPDVQIVFGQGQSATDTAGQINLIESMTSQGVKGIAITPVSPRTCPGARQGGRGRCQNRSFG